MRNHRLAPPALGSAPLVRLDDAAYNLWLARDDAHIAAWRSAGFEGPILDILSRLWSGEATTFADLSKLLEADQRPEDVWRGMNQLIMSGLIVRTEARSDNGTFFAAPLTLTERGYLTRLAIEQETDHLYFTPWPPLSAAAITWATATLSEIIQGLS